MDQHNDEFRERLKDALALWASGVCIVSAREDRIIHAVTVTAFNSISLDPPLVMVSLGRNASVLPSLQPDRPFGISILAAGQRRIGSMFADPAPIGRDVFSSDDPPVIRDALVTFTCEVDRRIEVGTHMLVLGRVLSIDGAMEGEPLIRFDRRWQRLRS